jgi:hypothetical protein
MKPTGHKIITDADQQIRNYYEKNPPSETEAFPPPLETISTSAQLSGRAERSDSDRTALSGGDPDVSSQGIDAGTETPGGSNPTPDQDLVDEVGAAAGMTYQDNEPLDFGEKATARDEARWELNPASAEDYQERQAALQSEPPPIPPGSTVGPSGDRASRGNGISKAFFQIWGAVRHSLNDHGRYLLSHASANEVGRFGI